MTYDKNSFLSGVAVGRQLKGWGQPAGGGEPRWKTALRRMTIRLITVPLAVPPGFGGQMNASLEEVP